MSKAVLAISPPKRTQDSYAPTPPSNKYKLVFLIVCIIICMYGKEFIVWEDGKPKLAPWRQEKLEEELESLDDAEQYVLIASQKGYYLCYSCPKSNIYLNVGEIWKYGVTTKGQSGRYPNGFPDNRLRYFVEFSGSIQECLKQEKLKIYNYALLTENLKRQNPIIRPPGNKIDK